MRLTTFVLTLANHELIRFDRSTSWHSVFQLEDIESIELMRAAEWSYSVNGMLINHGDDVFWWPYPQKSLWRPGQRFGIALIWLSAYRNGNHRKTILALR